MPTIEDPAALAALSDEALLEQVQRQCFRFFWDGADSLTGLAPDRRDLENNLIEVPVTIGGSGFGLMALIVAVERRLGVARCGAGKTGTHARLPRRRRELPRGVFALHE